MTLCHLVRVGAMGQVGRFHAAEGTCYPRGCRVVVRTARGLEVGEVLAPTDDDPLRADGPLVRAMTISDELLQARLEKNRQAAYEACQARLAGAGVGVPLVDVEHLFDGQTLVFYFLGPTPAGAERLFGELAEVYDATAQFSSFVDAVVTGCGPACGTSEAEGGGCGSCGTGCAVADACGSKRRTAVA